MDGTTETKVCPHCAETIKAAAKVCPHCRYWQKKWSIYNPKVVSGFVCAVILVYSVIMGLILDSIVGTGRSFVRYRSQIEVESSALNFGRTERDSFIATVGVVTNSSDVGWKELEFEVQYFDKDGKLVDVGTHSSDLTVLPHGEVAFRIRTVADKPESAYVSQKVFVRAAKDASKRF